MHGSAIKEMTGEMERGNVARVEREERERERKKMKGENDGL